MAKPRSVTKAHLLQDWMMAKPENPLRYMKPISEHHTGSTYGNDGIRIDGSPGFIMSVLSNLKPLIVGENALTRLSASLSEVAAREKTAEGVKFGAGTGTWCCYVRLHMRSLEGTMGQAYSPGARETTEEFTAVSDWAKEQAAK